MLFGSFSLQIHLIETLGQNARLELVLQTFYQLDFRAKKNYNESDLTSDSSLVCPDGRTSTLDWLDLTTLVTMTWLPGRRYDSALSRVTI